MRLVLWLVAAAALAPGCGDDGSDAHADHALPRAPVALRLSSPAFPDGSRLPRRYTCDGVGDEPAVRATNAPASIQELVLVVSDPDAPGGTYIHVARYGLKPQGQGWLNHGGREGSNSAGRIGWTAPCPPESDEPHRYVWAVYALRRPSGLAPGAAPRQVADALRGGAVAMGTITGRYGR